MLADKWVISESASRRRRKSVNHMKTKWDDSKRKNGAVCGTNGKTAQVGPVFTATVQLCLYFFDNYPYGLVIIIIFFLLCKLIDFLSHDYNQ